MSRTTAARCLTRPKLIDAAGPGALDGFRVDCDGNGVVRLGLSAPLRSEATDIGG